jgi:hypothetical protein
MYISLASSRSNGFKKWSDAHQPDSNDDDQLGGAKPIAIAVPPIDDAAATNEAPHRPWRVPGAGGSF